jgi:hypothetical protein
MAQMSHDHSNISECTVALGSRDSVVGIATGYGLEDRGPELESR